MASNKGLGKGLGALLGDFEEESRENTPYKLLPIQKVEPNRNQPRQDFDEEELQALSESLATHGILQPLTVRELDSGFESRGRSVGLSVPDVGFWLNPGRNRSACGKIPSGGCKRTAFTESFR